MGIGVAVLRREWRVAGAVILLCFLGGCGRPAMRPPAPAAKPPERAAVPRLGYTIQAGAFAVAENAARLTGSLQSRGLAATYFVAGKGLYKVRFGNFPTRKAARARAEEIRAAGLIDEFFIVSPDQYAVARREERGEAYLREELVRTAQSFLGVPYLWGGASAETGFDCSGLTMTVYQLNGLDIPRTSGEQFSSGTPVGRASLEKGDLLFFAKTGTAVSHVGVYAGDGQFIHSPGKGKRIRRDSLSQAYYRRTFLGARSYL
ncbi:MAG: C40 family peptidase [Syntrophales bacterium]